MVLYQGKFLTHVLFPCAHAHGAPFINSLFPGMQFATLETRSTYSPAAFCTPTSTASCEHCILVRRMPRWLMLARALSPPPKEQAQYDRYSVVFFTRPNDNVELRALADQNETIAEAVARAPPGKYTPGVTSEEWQVRRFKARRIANYKVSLGILFGRWCEYKANKINRVREPRAGRSGGGRWRRGIRMRRRFEGRDMCLYLHFHLYNISERLQVSAFSDKRVLVSALTVLY